MQVNSTPHLTFPKSGALGPFLRVVMSSGNLALAGALDRELGTTKERYLASGSLGQGDTATVVTPNAPGTVKMIAAGAISQWAKVYGAAAGQVSATANGNFIGYAMTATTAAGDELEVLRLHDSQHSSYVNVAASAAVTNTTTETDFDKTVTLPASSLKVGDVIKIRAQVIATATNSTDTLLLKLKIGSTVILATAAVDVANDDIGIIDVTLVVRTIGATGTFVACGLWALGVADTATFRPDFKASTTIDTTAAAAIAVSATWSVANAGNSCRLDILHVEIQKQ